MRLGEAAARAFVDARRRRAHASAIELGGMYRAAADGVASIERAFGRPLVVAPLLDCLESDREESLAAALVRAAETVEHREWI